MDLRLRDQVKRITKKIVPKKELQQKDKTDPAKKKFLHQRMECITLHIDGKQLFNLNSR